MDYKEKFIKNLKTKKDGTFILIGEYLNSRTKVKIKHLVCGYEWYTKPVVLLSAPPTKGCPECQRQGNSISSEDFPKVFYNKVNIQEFTLDESVPYKNNKSDLYVYHKDCGHRFKTYWATFCTNTSCPICRQGIGHRLKSPDTFIKEIDALFGKGVYEVLTSYTHALEKVLVKHTLCGSTFSIRAAHLRAGHGCPYCYSSIGEIRVRSILRELGYSFSEQVKFKDCLDKRPLPFDFYVTCENNCGGFLIEYDGIQHFKPFNYFGGEGKYVTQKQHDSIKDKFSEDKEIPLLRIAYNESDKGIKDKIQSMYNFVIGKNLMPNSEIKI